MREGEKNSTTCSALHRDVSESGMTRCERCGETVPKGYACTCPATVAQTTPCAFCGEESQYCWCFDLDTAYSKTSHAQVAAFMKEVFPERRRSWSRLHAKTTINKA